MSADAGAVANRAGPPLRGLRMALALPARFIGVGAINTAVGLSLIQIGLWLGLGDYPANAFGYAGGFGCSYLLHRRVTFRADDGNHRSQLPRFAAAAALAYALNLLVVAIGKRLGLGGTIIPHIAATGVYAAAFYWLSRRFVFPDRGVSAPAARFDWPARIEAATQSGWLIALLAVAAMLPLAFVATPPLVDAAGHMGRWIVQVDGGASPILRQWYGFKWGLLGNLGCDLLAQGLIPLIGPEAALRLIVAIILAVQVLGILALSRAVHGRIAPTAFFALPLVYGLPFQFGFLNFLLGEGFALLALALWITLEKRERQRTWLFVPIGFGLWLTHTMALAIFLLGAFCVNVASATVRQRLSLRVLWSSGLSLIPATLLPALAMATAHHGAGEPFAYELMIAKLIYPLRTLRDAWMLWDLASIGFISLAIYWFARSGRFSHDRGLTVFAIALLALYLVMPNTIQESQYADMRLVPLLFMLPLVAARPSAGSTQLFAVSIAIVGLVFTGSRWLGNGIAMAQRDAQFGTSLSVLQSLPAGKNLVSFYPMHCDPKITWNFDRRDHISGYALSRGPIFDSRQWQMSAGQLLRVHNPAAEPYAYERQVAVFDVPCGDRPGIHQAVAQLGDGIDTVWVIDAWPGLSFPGWRPWVSAGDSVLFRRLPANERLVAP